MSPRQPTMSHSFDPSFTFPSVPSSYDPNQPPAYPSSSISLPYVQQQTPTSSSGEQRMVIPTHGGQVVWSPEQIAAHSSASGLHPSQLFSTNNAPVHYGTQDREISSLGPQLIGSPSNYGPNSQLKAMLESSGFGGGAQHALASSSFYHASTDQEPPTPIHRMHHQGFYPRSHPTLSSSPLGVQPNSGESIAYAMHTNIGSSSRVISNRPSVADSTSTGFDSMGAGQGFMSNYYSPRPEQFNSLNFSSIGQGSPGTSVDTHSESDHAHYSHVVQPMKRNCPPLPTTFSPGAPNADPSLCLLLKAIQASEFFVKHDEEPHLGTRKANEILRQVTEFGGNFGDRSHLLGQSIYALFVGQHGSTCLFCQSPKSNLQRGIECVRSHLGHRPFECTGNIIGCLRCESSTGHAQFCNLRILKQHIDDQLNKRSSHPIRSDFQGVSQTALDQAPNQTVSASLLHGTQKRGRKVARK